MFDLQSSSRSLSYYVPENSRVSIGQDLYIPLGLVCRPSVLPSPEKAYEEIKETSVMSNETLENLIKKVSYQPKGKQMNRTKKRNTLKD